MTTVSVIIPTYHRPARLAAAVESALGQELPADTALEVIVCLSDPGDVEDRRVAAALAKDSRVRVVAATAPGPAAARNAGIRAAAGEVLAFLDDDCQAQDGWLISGLANLVDADLVQGRTTPERPPGLHERSLEVEPPSWLWETCNLMVRRSMIDRAGNFDESVHPTDDPRNHFGEDIEWGWRLVRSGARAVFAPEALVLHAVEASTRSRALRHQLRLRNVPWLVRTVPEARRHYIGGYFISRHHVLVALSAGCLVSAGIAAVGGRRRTALGIAALGIGGYLSPWRPVLTDIADRATFDAVQLAALVYGSLKWRRVIL